MSCWIGLLINGGSGRVFFPLRVSLAIRQYGQIVSIWGDRVNLMARLACESEWSCAGPRVLSVPLVIGNSQIRVTNYLGAWRTCPVAGHAQTCVKVLVLQECTVKGYDLTPWFASSGW